MRSTPRSRAGTATSRRSRINSAIRRCRPSSSTICVSSSTYIPCLPNDPIERQRVSNIRCRLRQLEQPGGAQFARMYGSLIAFQKHLRRPLQTVLFHLGLNLRLPRNGHRATIRLSVLPVGLGSTALLSSPQQKGSTLYLIALHQYPRRPLLI